VQREISRGVGDARKRAPDAAVIREQGYFALKAFEVAHEERGNVVGQVYAHSSSPSIMHSSACESVDRTVP
jgi:hypothetical protein